VAERKRALTCHWVLTTLFVVALVSGACSSDRDNPEKQVRSLLAQGETAAEQKQAGTLRQMISEKYSDSQGQDKKAIESTLRYYLLRHQTIHLFTRIREIAFPAPDLAHVDMMVAMAGQPIANVGELERLQADLHRFEINLVREQGEWKVLRAEWRRAEIGDFL